MQAKSVKRNILANVFGGGWGLLLSLVTVPIQLRILGAEAYGLVGLIASLQVILVILDFGLTTTVIHEVASDTSADRQTSRELVQTSATVYWIIAALVGAAFALGSDWIARHWLKLDALQPEYAATSLRIMALYVTLTWPITLYASAITGLQRLETVNLIKGVMAAVSQVGGIAVLFLTRELQNYLWWITLSSLINVGLHALVCQHYLPGLRLGLRLSRAVIRRIWNFAFDMNLVSTASILYTQSDKLLISTLLPLRMLGYYNVAYKLMSGISLIPGTIASAALPTLSAYSGQGNREQVNRHYNTITQLIVYLIAAPVFVSMFFGRDFLLLWTTPDAAENAYRPLAMLTFGTLLSATVSVCYMLLVATQRTRLLLKIYLFGLPLYFVYLYGGIALFGLVGAALAWVLLSVYLILTMLVLAQRRIVGESTLIWLNRNLTPFVLLGVGIFFMARALVTLQNWDRTLVGWGVCVLALACYLAAGFAFLDSGVRRSVLSLPAQIMNRLSPHSS